MGKKEEFNKLSKSLQIDNNYYEINWKPPVGFEEGIKEWLILNDCLLDLISSLELFFYFHFYFNMVINNYK